MLKIIVRTLLFVAFISGISTSAYAIVPPCSKYNEIKLAYCKGSGGWGGFQCQKGRVVECVIDTED